MAARRLLPTRSRPRTWPSPSPASSCAARAPAPTAWARVCATPPAPWPTPSTLTALPRSSTAKRIVLPSARRRPGHASAAWSSSAVRATACATWATTPPASWAALRLLSGWGWVLRSPPAAHWPLQCLLAPLRSRPLRRATPWPSGAPPTPASRSMVRPACAWPARALGRQRSSPWCRRWWAARSWAGAWPPRPRRACARPWAATSPRSRWRASPRARASSSNRPARRRSWGPTGARWARTRWRA